MHRLSVVVFSVIVTMLLSTLSLAQHPPIPSTNSIVQSATSGASGTFSPSEVVMIKNRARVLGNKVDGSGTRYFAVTDSDLIDKTPQEVVQRLSPPTITSGDRVRNMDIVVDLQHPVTIYAPADQPPSIGTVTISDSDVHSVEVNSFVLINDLRVISNRRSATSDRP